MTKRALGRSGIEVSAIGMGCWAIGGPWSGPDGGALGWGAVDDEESVRAVRAAVDLGVTFFDTSDTYGTGHSERVLGRALAGLRDRVVVATKWGHTFDEAKRQMTGKDPSVEHLRSAVEASLRRLGTDHIDLLQLHPNLTVEQGAALLPALEDLVAAGTIRGYGWSTDDVTKAGSWAQNGAHCISVQHELSVLRTAPEMLDMCERYGVASIGHSPLAMGLLSGKYAASDTLGKDDIRGAGVPFITTFAAGHPVAAVLDRIAAVREVLTAGGRTPAQGALAWVLAHSPRTIPIPGFRTVAQVEENAGVLTQGPLTDDQLAEVERLLGR